MTTVERRADIPGSVVPGVPVVEAAALRAEDVLARLGTSVDGLSEVEAAQRLRLVGPNAVRSHHVQPLRILGRQLRNAVLILLGVTALVSFFLGQRTDTIVIAVILLASIGLGFVNEFRAERAAEALHSQVKHRAVATRGGRPEAIDVTILVPGDIVMSFSARSFRPTSDCSARPASSATRARSPASRCRQRSRCRRFRSDPPWATCSRAR